MKLEVGMYVRHKTKGIFKITSDKIHKDHNRYFINVDQKYTQIDMSNIIGEPSFNVIELIEVGDYVNGSRVIKIQNVENYPDLLNVKIEKSDFRYGVHETIFKKDIKSIVTKEQFEALAYKVS